MVQIWTDASFKEGNGGLACLVRYRDKKTGRWREVKGTVAEPCKNNNIAELKAAVLGLKTARHVPSKEGQKWNIVTDSMYVIRTLQNAESFDARNERGALAKEAQELLKGKRWAVYHKKGHDRKGGRYARLNNRVDALACSVRD